MTDEQFAEWVEEHLTQVDARLSEVIAPQTDFVREAANYLISLSSKRFRPALVVAAGGLGLPCHGSCDSAQDDGDRYGAQDDGGSHAAQEAPSDGDGSAGRNPSHAAHTDPSAILTNIPPVILGETPSHAAQTAPPSVTLAAPPSVTLASPPSVILGGTPSVIPRDPPPVIPRVVAESINDPSADSAFLNQALIDSAVVVELTHVASLYHDDVMDEAPVRRGAASANVKWGNSVAVMIGDFLLATASLVGSTLGEAFVAHQSRTLARLVQGQIAELRGPAEGADPVAHHLSVLADKTASLIAASARYGGMVAGLEADQLEELTAFGESLGLCFQLADDLIDILSTDSGKTVGTDLREGVLTMGPLMIIRENRPEDARLVELLSAPVPEEDIPEALSLLRAHPALDKVRQFIAEQVALATSHLDTFPDSPAKRALIALADQAVYRTN